MSHVSETFAVTEAGINFVFSVVNYESNDGFGDQWDLTDDHEGGVTVKNPNYDRNSYKFAIPLQYSLGERVKDLLDQGMPATEASAEAYRRAVKSLERDLDATDYGFTVSASVDGVDLLSDVVIGCGFDYSYHDQGTLLEAAQEVYKDYGMLEEAVILAKEAAADLISKMDALKKIA